MILLLLIRLGSLEIVKVLANSDECNLEAADNSGWTPLHWAVR